MFFKLSWNIQLAAAITLFVISFFIEARVLEQYLNDPILAYALAGALELSKALSIVLYRFFRSGGDSPYPTGVALLTALFRVGLVLLSLTATVMYLAVQLDKPGLEAVRSLDISAAENQARHDREGLDHQYAGRRARIQKEAEERFGRLMERADELHGGQIRELEGLLRDEMHNRGTGGNFIGPRYRELSRRLEQEKQAYQARLDQLATRNDTDTAARLRDLDKAYARASEQLRQTARERIATLQISRYDGDMRVENPFARAFLGVLRDVAELEVSHAHLALGFALFLSLIMELGILVGFEHVTLTHMPVFAAEAKAATHLGRKRVETGAELESQILDDDLIRHKTRARRKTAQRRMDDFVNDVA